MISREKFCYYCLPLLMFSVCLGLVLAGASYSGWYLFEAFPVFLLIWLVYWGVKKPEIRPSWYYLFVLWFFCTFAIAGGQTIFFNILNIDEVWRQKISFYLKYSSLVIFVLLLTLKTCFWKSKNKTPSKGVL